MSNLADYDLGEYAAAYAGLGAFAAYDLGEYAYAYQKGLGWYDFGEYTRVAQDLGSFGQYDLGEYAHDLTRALGQYDLGEYADVSIGLGSLGRYDLGEYGYISLDWGTLGRYDLGEYSYIYLRDFPAGDWFPQELVGLSWPVVESPEFSTGIKRASSGRELRTAYRSKPLWKIALRYEYLKDATRDQDPFLNYMVQRLLGFITKQWGGLKNFLFLCPENCEAVDEQFGIGDGATKVFQLKRTIGSGVDSLTENVQNVKYLYDVKIGGKSVNGHVDNVTVINNPCVVDTFGVATFSTAPANGAALTWTGEYFYRCRFAGDADDFTNFADKLWALAGLPLVGSPENIV